MTKKILLADDSVTIQKVVELTFMDEDYEVSAVSDGDAALASLKSDPPDLVIADVHMPGSDGYSVCREAKQIGNGIPVVLLVGTFEAFDESMASSAGADAHLKKPFDSQELLQIVGELTSRGTAAPEEPAAVEQSVPPAFASSEAPEADTAVFPEKVADADSLFGAGETAADDLFTTAGSGAADSPFEMAEEVSAEAEPTAFEESPAAPEAESSEGGAAETEAFGLEAPIVEATPAFEAEPVVEPVPVAELPATEESPGAHSTQDVPTREVMALEVDDEPEAAASETDEADTAAVATVTVAANGAATLSDDDVDRIARRMVELASEKVLREVAWEVIPDLAEVVIKERIRDLESQIE